MSAAAAVPNFSRTWKAGFSDVLCLRLIRAQKIRDKSSRTTRDWIFCLLRLVALPLLPIALNLILLLFGSSMALPGSVGNLWLCAFALVNALMLAAAFVAWWFVDKRSVVVDGLITDPVHRLEMVRNMKNALSQRPQMITSVTFGVLGVPFLALASSPMSRVVGVGLASYVSFVITLMIGSNVIYWLLRGPAFVDTLLRSSTLKLRWYQPATTPAMRLIADACGLAALLLLGEAVAITVLAFVSPGAMDVPILRWTLIGFFVLTIVTAAWLVGRPLLRVSKTCANSVRMSMREIQSKLPGSAAVFAASHTAEDIALLEVYDRLANAQKLPFSTGAIVQYGAALVSTIIAFVLSLR